MTTSESKCQFFKKTNRLESIRLANRIDSNRELECSSGGFRFHCRYGPCDQYRPRIFNSFDFTQRKHRTQGNCVKFYETQIICVRYDWLETSLN